MLAHMVDLGSGGAEGWVYSDGTEGYWHLEPTGGVVALLVGDQVVLFEASKVAFVQLRGLVRLVALAPEVGPKS